VQLFNSAGGTPPTTSVRTTHEAKLPPAWRYWIFCNSTDATEYDGIVLGTLAFLLPMKNSPEFIWNSGDSPVEVSGFGTKKWDARTERLWIAGMGGGLFPTKYFVTSRNFADAVLVPAENVRVVALQV